MTPDANVLVAASRSDHPHHGSARTWLQQALADAEQGDTLKLQPMVIASFLRLVTHPKIFVQRTTVSEAVRFIDALLAAPGVERPALGGEWPVLRRPRRSSNPGRSTWACMALPRSVCRLSSKACSRRISPHWRWQQAQCRRAEIGRTSSSLEPLAAGGAAARGR